jgi:surface-adhesin protein E
MPLPLRPYRRVPLASILGFWLLITLLVLSSGHAYAEWVAIGGNDQIGMTTYVDPTTIRRNSNLVKIWQLNDFKTVQTVEGNSFLSTKKQRQFNCAEERTRILAATQFSGNMGNGEVVWVNSNEQKWEPVIPGSIGQTLWEFACGKK